MRHGHSSRGEERPGWVPGEDRLVSLKPSQSLTDQGKKTVGPEMNLTEAERSMAKVSQLGASGRVVVHIWRSGK